MRCTRYDAQHARHWGIVADINLAVLWCCQGWWHEIIFFYGVLLNGENRLASTGANVGEVWKHLLANYVAAHREAKFGALVSEAMAAGKR